MQNVGIVPIHAIDHPRLLGDFRRLFLSEGWSAYTEPWLAKCFVLAGVAVPNTFYVRPCAGVEKARPSLRVSARLILEPMAQVRLPNWV